MTKSVFEVQASADGSALTLNLFGRIGGGMFDEGITANMVQRQLDQHPHAREIQCNLSSPGGNMFEAQAIRSILAAHPANVTVDVVGLAASAGSLLAMCGDKIRMHEGASMMVHDATTMTQGGVSDHNRAIAALGAADTNMADLYAARSGKTAAQCKKMMAAETWMTAAQAVAEGFADEVIKGKPGAPQTAPQACLEARFDTRDLGYARVPVEYAHFFITAQATTLPPAPLTQPTGELTVMADYTRIAQALSLTADAGEGAVFSALDKLKDKAATADKAVAQLYALTGTQDISAAFGVVQAHAEAAKQLPIVKEQADTQAKALETAERAALFAADSADAKGRKLTPAMQAYWAERPVKELREFLAVAPVVIANTAAATGGAQPPVNAGPAAGKVAPILYEGKTWEQHVAEAPSVLAELHSADPAQYAALKANHEERGRPRAHVTQPRAGA
jgi:ATP-dependent protease ClpP protease subunit